MFSFGRPNIEKLKNAGDVKGLARALSRKNQAVSFDAVAALADIRTNEAVDALFDALEIDGVSSLAGEHILELYDSRTADRLFMAAHALKAVNASDAERAIQTMGQEAIGPLLALFDDLLSRDIEPIYARIERCAGRDQWTSEVVMETMGGSFMTQENVLDVRWVDVQRFFDSMLRTSTVVIHAVESEAPVPRFSVRLSFDRERSNAYKAAVVKATKWYRNVPEHIRDFCAATQRFWEEHPM